MKFSKVSEKFTEMSQTRKRLELTAILVDLLKEAQDDLKELVYLIQGKLAPDYEGIQLGMADKQLAKGLSAISGKPQSFIDEKFAKEGDLGNVAKEIMSSRAQNALFGEEMTVKHLHQQLMNLSRTSGKGSVEQKLKIYEDLLLNSTPEDAMYITRIITGKLRLGVSDSTILDALISAFADKEHAEEINEAYNFHPDLGLIAELLRSGEIDKVRAMGPELFVPAKVMLAERLPGVHEIIEKMSGNSAFEFKYDGIRTQIHKKGKEVRIYSRGSEETTKNFPDIVRNARETFTCESCILDGESVPYNSETGEMYPFQMVSQRRGRKHDLEEMEKEVPIVVFLFDIIYLNGKQLHKVPYPDRRKILESLFTEDDKFKLATRLVSSDEKKVTAFFNEAISSGCEGLVAKNTSEQSIYRAGARGWLWIKLKREYESEFNDTLDLVVVGAFTGHGRRKGTYGALLLASYNEVDDTFETICKLGSGFTDDVLFNLPKKFADKIVKDKPARVESKLVPDVWIEPEQVLEVKGAEITVSPIHTCDYAKVEKDAGLAVRFPRFTGRWREDKKPEDATTSKEILEMFNSQKKSIK